MAQRLEQYEGLTDPDEKGVLLRREGLYSSHNVAWRRARGARREWCRERSRPGAGDAHTHERQSASLQERWATAPAHLVDRVRLGV